MKVVVITGGTKGIGFGLAEAFLSRGCSVVICGRSEQAVALAVQSLQSQFMASRVLGFPCDVTDYKSVQALWNQTLQNFGRIDIWINNAGQNFPRKNFWEQNPEQLKELVSTNFTGTVYGAQVAVKGMIQQGHGRIYNMLGAENIGFKINGYTLYDSTKQGINYFTGILRKEVRGTKIKVGTIAPGMVITDLLLKGNKEKSHKLQFMKMICNILGDKVETVAPWIADKILVSNNSSSEEISWLTKEKIFWRLLISPFRKRKLVA